MWTVTLQQQWCVTEANQKGEQQHSFQKTRSAIKKSYDFTEVKCSLRWVDLSWHSASFWANLSFLCIRILGFQTGKQMSPKHSQFARFLHYVKFREGFQGQPCILCLIALRSYFSKRKEKSKALLSILDGHAQYWEIDFNRLGRMLLHLGLPSYDCAFEAQNWCLESQNWKELYWSSNSTGCSMQETESDHREAKFWKKKWLLSAVEPCHWNSQTSNASDLNQIHIIEIQIIHHI